MNKDDTFVWPNGNSLSSYTHWGGPESTAPASQPELYAGPSAKYCVYLSSIYRYTWFTEDCFRNKPGYICELSAHKDNIGKKFH